MLSFMKGMEESQKMKLRGRWESDHIEYCVLG